MRQARDDPTLLIEFNAHEIVFLTDIIPVDGIDVGDPDFPNKVEPIGRSLLLKLGAVFLQVVTPEGLRVDESREVQLTEKESWLLKAKVRFGDMGIGGKPVGVTILLKVIAALNEFNQGKPGVLPSLEEIPISVGPDHAYNVAFEAAKTKKRRKGHAGSEDNPDDETSNYPRA